MSHLGVPLTRSPTQRLDFSGASWTPGQQGPGWKQVGLWHPHWVNCKWRLWADVMVPQRETSETLWSL